MKTFQSTHLGTGDVAKIKNLSDGVFDDTVLYRLLALLATSFESYNPDNTVMTYLKQHAQTLKHSDGNISSISDPQGKRKKSKIKARIRKVFIRKSARTNPPASQIATHPQRRE